MVLQELNGLGALVENEAIFMDIFMDYHKRSNLLAFYKLKKHLLKKDKKTLNMLKKYGYWKRFKGAIYNPKGKHLIAFYEGKKHLLKRNKKIFDILKKYEYWEESGS